MKKFIFAIVIIVVALGVGLYVRNSRENSTLSLTQKLYVAVEGMGKVAVINPLTRKVAKYIDLSGTHDGEALLYAPHNVQVSPNGATVWVTANAGVGHDDHSFLSTKRARAHGTELPFDDVIVIDALTDTIKGRIAIAPEAHLAHVELTPDNKFAYVTAQTEGAIYKINAETFLIDKRIEVPAGSEPHGLRISPNGQRVFVAESKGLGWLETSQDEYATLRLKGKAIQAGVTPNGEIFGATIYDTKSVAIFNDTWQVSYVDLPAAAKGPIQMYPTPDSKYFYIADQGYYFGQPEGDTVYKIDVIANSVVKEIKVGRAPHGVVVTPDGKFVYVTNLLSGDVSIIDTATDLEVAKIPVGKEPNGVSFWEGLSN